MNKQLSAYRMHIGAYGMTSFVTFRPTGRWKIVSGPYCDEAMFVEHHGWIFDEWVHENNIVFLPAESEQMFDCRAD